MRLNDRFDFSFDPPGWIVTERIPSVKKDGSTGFREKLTYHATLGQVCSSIIDQSVGSVEAIEEIEAMQKQTIAELSALLLQLTDQGRAERQLEKATLTIESLTKENNDLKSKLADEASEV